MTTHEQILILLKGCSSQKPMRFNDLVIESGYCAEPLHMLLDQMYDARLINQAIVTRAGVKQREVWPVSIVNSANPYRSGVATAPAIPPPRRNEAPAIQPKEVTMNINHDEKMPRALTILKYIEANPLCNSSQITHATGIDAPRSYIKAHITRGAVLVSGDNRKDMKMQLAADRTAEAIYGNGYTKAKPAPSAALLAEVRAAHADVDFPDAMVRFQPHAEPAPTYDIPAFLRKSEEQQPVEPAEVVKFDTDLGFYPDTVLNTTITQPSQDDFAIDAINTLFDLLPPESAIVIGRADGVLQIDIEADVFGTPVTKTVQLNEVISILSALHIVTVEMA